MDLKSFAVSVAEGRELTADEAQLVADQLASSSVDASDKEAFLENLTNRGEMPGEIAAFAKAFRQLARDPGLGEWAPRAIDVCGTGGDKSGSFNISTTVGIMLAAAGVPVIKHGNRSITSKCGSADLLEKLGIRLDDDPDLLAKAMDELGFVFLFAPNYHPAFKEIVPVRKALAARGVRTVFNLMGPLLNPAKPAFQVMGIFSEPFVQPAADALHELELDAGYVVHSTDAGGAVYDELTVCGRNIAAGFGRFRSMKIDGPPEELGLPTGPASHLAGGDVDDNVRILDQLLDGRGPKALIDSVLLGTAAALHAVGRVESIESGLEPARNLLRGGAAKDWLQRARSFYGR